MQWPYTEEFISRLSSVATKIAHTVTGNAQALFHDLTVPVNTYS